MTKLLGYIVVFVLLLGNNVPAREKARPIAAMARASVASGSTTAGAVLPEFAFREYNLTVTNAAGKPLSGALVYGWCREYNLVWPRPDEADDPTEGRGIAWSEESLGKTGADGSVKVSVPRGKWGFIATGESGNNGGVVAAWSDFRDRQPGEAIRLTVSATKHWTLISADGAAMTPRRFYFKPDGFPIWIPATSAQPAPSVTVELSGGKTQLWATGDATSDALPGFAMSWGSVSDATPDGKLPVSEKPAVIECHGSSGKAWVLWRRYYSPGLYGEVALPAAGKVLITPGDWAISYRRPVTPALTGGFAPQARHFTSGEVVSYNLGGPLAAELDQDRDKLTPDKLCARLYLMDANGHPLANLRDTSGKEAKIGATVTLNGQRYAAKQVIMKSRFHGTTEEGGTLFEAKLGAPLVGSTVWEFQAPEGVLPKATMTSAVRAGFKSRTFETEAAAIVGPQAQNVLAQADLLGAAMDNVTGRQRHVPVTDVRIEPGHTGASASHNGEKINFHTEIFLTDEPVWRHTFVHELAHNFGLSHGGLMETVVEATRSYGCEQYSGQMAKWLFFDRMNGIQYKERPYLNTGLYLYCYAVGGQPFLRFLLANEQTVKSKLGNDPSVKGKAGKGSGLFTDDELTAALLSLAFNRDVSRICNAYGLDARIDRVALAANSARSLCRQP